VLPLQYAHCSHARRPMSAWRSSVISSLRGIGEHTRGDQYAVGGLLVGVQVGVEHPVGWPQRTSGNLLA
jgi:hypothetical protein